MLKYRDFVIRKAKPKDVWQLSQLFEEIVREGQWFLDNPRNWYGQVRRAIGIYRSLISQKKTIYLVVIKDKKVVGFLIARALVGRRSHVAYMGLALDGRYRKKGLGTALQKEGFRVAKDLGFLKVRSEIIATNKAAITTVLALGTVIEGRRKKAIKIGDEYIDLIMVAKYL